MPRTPGIHIFDSSRGPLAPLAFLLVVSMVMVAGLFWLTRSQPEDLEVPVRKQVQGDEVNINIIEFPFDPKVSTWGNVNDLNPVGQSEIPVAAFKKAADAVAENSWQRMKTSSNAVTEGVRGFTRFDARAIMGSPTSKRGLPVEVLGELTALKYIDLFDEFDAYKLPDGRFRVIDGIMYSRKNVHGSRVPIRFTLLDEQKEVKIDPVTGPEPRLGTQVKLQGVFFKVQRFNFDGEETTGVWILGKRLHRSFQLPDPADYDHNTLMLVQDAQTILMDQNRNLFDEDAMFHALTRVHHANDIDPKVKAAEEVISLKGRGIQDLQKDPKKYRGKVIEFRGRVLQIDRHEMNAFFPENAPGDNAIDGFWSCYITPDATIPVTVFSLAPPPEGLKKKDEVRVKGLFYRLWGYRSKSLKPGEPKWTRAPLLVAIEPLEIVEKPHAGPDYLAWGIVGFTVLAGLIVGLVLWKDRRQSRLFADTQRARRQLTRKRSS